MAKENKKVPVQINPIYVDLETAAAVTSLSTAVLQVLVRKGEFPKPRELSSRRVGWLYRELLEWSEARPISSMLPPPNVGKRAIQAQAS